jgi:DNA repair exonuclease SbcCD ATPase subunit
MPGIHEELLLEDLSPGLNLIVGRNGSGKSSICRAIQATLWPGSAGLADADVESEWRGVGAGGDAGSASLVARLTSDTRWRWNDGSIHAPPLPPAHLAPAYVLQLRDLLSDRGEADLRLADELRVLVSGGYDLASLRSSIHPGRHGRQSESALVEAERALRALRGDRRRLATEQDRLSELRAQHARARAAIQEANALTRCLERADLQREMRGMEARLAGLRAAPEALARIGGGELEALDRIDADLAGYLAEEADAARRIRDDERALQRVALPAGPVDVAELAAWRSRARELERHAGDCARQEAEALRLAAAREAAHAALGGEGCEIALEPGAALDPDELDRLERALLRGLSLRERRLQIDARQSAWAERESALHDGASPEHLQQAVGLVRDRISLAEAGPVYVPVALLLLGLAALAGLLFSIARFPAWTAPGAALGGALAAVLLGTLGGRLRAWHRRRALARAYAALGLGPLETGALPAQLRALEEHIAAAEGASRAALERATLAAEERALEGERSRLAAWIGGAAAHGDLASSDLLDRVRRWRAAEAAAGAAAAELAERSEQLQKRLGRLRDWLVRRLGVRPDDVAHAVALLDEAAERNRQEQAIAQRREATEREHAAAERRARASSTRRSELLAAAGVEAETDPRFELARRLDDLPEYLELCDALRLHRAQIAALSEPLEAGGPVLDLARDAAEMRLAEAQRRAEGADALAREIGTIEERVRAAGESGELEERRAAVERTREAMLERRSEVASAQAGDWLLAGVEAEYEQVSRPKVLQCAAEWFAAFTRNRLELVSPGAGTTGGLRARETTSGAERALHELSDGTRTQLLLAARLAFATAEERGARPPILLDEALTATDPERFRAVVQALLALVEAGRQVFYLTCSPADVASFEQVAREADAPLPRVFDLDVLGGGEGLRAAASPAAARGRSPRSVSEGCAADDYAASPGVPAPDPFAPIGELHLHHLLRDDPRLLDLLLGRAEVERIGHWRALRAGGGAEKLFSLAVCEHVDALVSIAEAFLEAWRIGRARPLSPAVLAASGCVSDKFLDRLSELARDLGGDAEALLNALEAGADERTKRFRSAAREGLREVLSRSGHLVARPPLAPADLHAVLLTRVREAGGPAATWTPEAIAELAIGLARTLESRDDARAWVPGDGRRAVRDSS